MYFLNFHIDKQAAPVIRSAHRHAADVKGKKAGANSFDWKLGYFILLVEGFHKHAANLPLEEASKMLEGTKKVTQQFYALRESASGLEVLADAEAVTKLRYAIKALNRLEALLHLASTKGLEVQQTPAHVKEGLAAYSKEAISQSLSKN